MGRPRPTPIIEVRGLSKSFGRTRALAQVDLEVAEGQVFALLGPNGAGKTTLVRILCTLLRPDGGRARVAGYDVVERAAMARTRIGLTGQFASVDQLLTPRENLAMLGRLLHLPRSEGGRRVDQLLDIFDLDEAADRQVRTLSGGTQRRLDLAASLVGSPPVLVLDEPTTGLDPRSRSTVWEAVDQLVAQGTTVLLTTQYLEEADRLAHQVAVLDQGRIVGLGTPDQLKAELGGDVLHVQVGPADQFARAAAAVEGLGLHGRLDVGRRTITVPAPEGMGTLRAALDLLDGAGIEVDDIGIRRPSLDEVFLALTGRVGPQDSAAAPEPSSPAPEPPSPAPEPPSPAPPSPAPAPPPPSPAPDPGGGSGRGHLLSDSWVIARRNLRRIRRTPRLLIVSSIQPVLYVLMFCYVFGRSLHTAPLSYVDYLLPGMLVTATLLGATTAVAIATDLRSGMVDRFRSLPIARSAVLTGRCLSDVVRSAVVVAIVLTVGTVIGFRFHSTVPDVALALFLALAFGFAFIWLYALIGLVVGDPETAQIAGFLTVLPLVFASSVFVQVDAMPSWMQPFAEHQPVTVTVDAVRALCEGLPVGSALWEAAAWIIGIIVVCGSVAVARYRRVA